MTPRSLFVGVSDGQVQQAAELAERNDLEAIPVFREGHVVGFWSRSAGRVKRVSRRHRVEHSDGLEQVLPRLSEQLVQFVHYRGQIVGLVDVSDLNKPIARLAFLGPMLDCEQAIFSAARARQFSETQVIEALGTRAAKSALGRRRKAAREDLNAPLLEFAYFSEVLTAATQLGLVSVSDAEAKFLADVRNRSAHAARKLVEQQADTRRLMAALELCRRVRKGVGDVGTG